MTNEEQSNKAEKTTPFGAASAEFASMGKKRVEEFSMAQAELLEKLQEARRQWIERMQTEASLASEFAGKLSAARSMPEAMTIWQEWTSRRFEMMAEDGQRLLADTQKFMETAARLMSDGWANRAGLRT